MQQLVVLLMTSKTVFWVVTKEKNNCPETQVQMHKILLLCYETLDKYVKELFYNNYTLTCKYFQMIPVIKLILL